MGAIVPVENLLACTVDHKPLRLERLHQTLAVLALHLDHIVLDRALRITACNRESENGRYARKP